MQDSQHKSCDSPGFSLEISVAPMPLFHPLWGNIPRNLILFGKLIPGMYFLPTGTTAATLAFLSTGIPCPVLSHCSSRFETLQLYGFLLIYFSLNLPSFFPGICKEAGELQLPEEPPELEQLLPCHKCQSGAGWGLDFPVGGGMGFPKFSA